jgi:error-prone DNA polymerase
MLVQELELGRHDRARALLQRLQSAFAPGDLYVELQLPAQQGDAARARALCELARQANVPVVATGNVHAHTRLRARLHEALVAIRHNTSLEACEAARAGNLALQLHAPASMAQRFHHHPDAVHNTRRIAERIEFDLTGGLGYRYPGMHSEQDGNAIRRLTELCDEIFERRYAGRSTYRSARQRLDQELGYVAAHELANFFLLHHDVFQLAREVARDVRGADSARASSPPGRGRGSSVESIICYLTGLSHVDPLEHDLKLGRFLNEDLISVPDIDLDFPRDIRHELLRRVVERYGADHCALVAAHATYRTKGAIRDQGSALGLPPGELRQLAQR